MSESEEKKKGSAFVNLLAAFVMMGTLVAGAALLHAGRDALQGAEGLQATLASLHADMETRLNEGDAQAAQGDSYGAMVSYRDALATSRQMAVESSSDIEMLRSLPAAFLRIGDASRSQGDDAAAMAAYQDGMELVQRLASQPVPEGSTAAAGNAELQRVLAGVRNQMGAAMRHEGGGQAALDLLRAGLEAAGPAVEEQVLSADRQDFQQGIHSLKNLFGKVRDKVQDHAATQ